MVKSWQVMALIKVYEFGTRLQENVSRSFSVIASGISLPRLIGVERSLSPDGQTLASNRETCHSNLARGDRSTSCTGTFTVAVVYSPDGQQLVSASMDQRIKVWDVKTGECLRKLEGHTKWIYPNVYIPSW